MQCLSRLSSLPVTWHGCVFPFFFNRKQRCRVSIPVIAKVADCISIPGDRIRWTPWVWKFLGSERNVFSGGWAKFGTPAQGRPRIARIHTKPGAETTRKGIQNLREICLDDLQNARATTQTRNNDQADKLSTRWQQSHVRAPQHRERSMNHCRHDCLTEGTILIFLAYMVEKCRDPGSNRGPSDLRSDALPAELSLLLRSSRIEKFSKTQDILWTH